MPWGAVGSEFPKMRVATGEIVPFTTRWVARAGTKMKRRAFYEAVVCVASHAEAADPRFSGAPMEGGARTFGREPIRAPATAETYARIFRRAEQLRLRAFSAKSVPLARVFGKLPYRIRVTLRLCIQDIEWRGTRYG
jgi:hypothetical protein